MSALLSRECFGMELDTLIDCLPPAPFKEALIDAIGELRHVSRKQALEEAIDACSGAEEPSWTGYECPNTFNDGKYAAEAAIKDLLK